MSLQKRRDHLVTEFASRINIPDGKLISRNEYDVVWFDIRMDYPDSMHNCCFLGWQFSTKQTDSVDYSQATALTTCQAMALICRACSGDNSLSASTARRDGPYMPDTVHQCPSCTNLS